MPDETIVVPVLDPTPVERVVERVTQPDGRVIERVVSADVVAVPEVFDVCPRHGDRETNVCAKCHQPACARCVLGNDGTRTHDECNVPEPVRRPA